MARDSEFAGAYGILPGIAIHRRRKAGYFPIDCALKTRIARIMLLEIDDEVFGRLVMTGEEVRLDLALGLFMSRRLTLGRAAEVAGISQMDFLEQLGQRGIPLH